MRKMAASAITLRSRLANHSNVINLAPVSPEVTIFRARARVGKIQRQCAWVDEITSVRPWQLSNQRRFALDVLSTFEMTTLPEGNDRR